MSLPRHFFDENQPQGSMSLANLRHSLRALFQCDLMPLRPRASMVLDAMEYSTDAAAAAVFAGTGVTVTKTNAGGEFQEGSYALKCVIDGTNNRSVGKTQALNLSAFLQTKVWTRCSATSSAIQFYLRDGSGNESYWNITTHGTANTWKQDTLTLASPNANNGTPANLASIASWGYRLLDNSVSYWFDTVKAVVGMKVAINGVDLASFYRPLWIGQNTPLAPTTQGSPTITAPSSNPRIDLLTIDSAGTLAWTAGSEGASPSAPNCPTGKMPICYVYCKTTMTKVLDYEDKDSDSNQGYIYADVRPFLNLGSSPEIFSGTDAGKPAAGTANRFYWATDTKKLYWDSGSAWTDITAEFAGFVRDTGNQTVAGVKTFSSIPVLPASSPTLDDQATRKKYVDDGLALKLDSGATAGGDLSSTYPNPTVAKIQGRSVQNAAPSDGQVLKWNNSQSRWEPAAAAGAWLVTSAFGQPVSKTQSGTDSYETLNTAGDGTNGGEQGITFYKAAGVSNVEIRLNVSGGDGNTRYRAQVGTVNGGDVSGGGGWFQLYASLDVSSLATGWHTVNIQTKQVGGGSVQKYLSGVAMRPV